MGPCQELFGGVYSSIDVFYNIAEALGLSRSSPPSNEGDNWDKDYPDKFGYHHYTESNPRYGAASNDRRK